MPNLLQKIIDFLVAVLLMFMIPVLYFSLKKDTLIQVNVDWLTKGFVESVVANGYVNRQMYEKYVTDLSGTDKLYQVLLTHEQTAYEPEYRCRSAAEVINENENLWHGTNDYYASDIVTEIPVVNDPINNGNLNTETNESVLAKAVVISADPNHVHSDECYDGIKHVHNADCGGTHVSPPWITVIDETNSTYHHGCGGTIYSNFTVTVCSGCGASHQTTRVWCDRCGMISSSSDYYGNCTCTGKYVYTCNKKANSYYKGDSEVFPICNEKIIAISPTHPIQTVYVNDPLITTVEATYRDGSRKTVECTTDFSTANILQNQSAILTYTYKISDIMYTKTAIITVTAIPRIKTCINGHTYNLNGDGTDPGCPYCKNWLRSLAVFIPPNGSLAMYRNINGSLVTEGVGLIAVYLDGHTEYVYSGYVDNLDPNYVGLQTVAIGYKGLTTTLSVNVVRNRKPCDVCGLYYNLYMDDTDPGCPYCKAKVPVFTGYVLKYTAATFDDEILTELYEGAGTYYFRRGDEFTVSADSRNSITSFSVLGRLFSLEINASFSEEVKNEVLHN
ncbi:MAG TPA: hypothetical protein VJ888_07690 [Mobilitalea sp.]|nr:hypothetical protein [Mobilitalea sp.]